MLLAELHGKRFPESEGQEDLLTSAVFGHLRHISPQVFWKALFSRAHTATSFSRTLDDALAEDSVDLRQYTQLRSVFWSYWSTYGEPDLILVFSGPGLLSVVVLIEVKLNSRKSGTGQNDQLAKYLRLLADPVVRTSLVNGDAVAYLIYLTRSFAQEEIQESARASDDPDAANKLFGLTWRDILEIAASQADEDGLIAEVAKFLRIRNFEAFGGMTQTSLPATPQGSFYFSRYFTHRFRLSQNEQFNGRFLAH